MPENPKLDETLTKLLLVTREIEVVEAMQSDKIPADAVSAAAMMNLAVKLMVSLGTAEAAETLLLKLASTVRETITKQEGAK